MRRPLWLFLLALCCFQCDFEPDYELLYHQSFKDVTTDNQGFICIQHGLEKTPREFNFKIVGETDPGKMIVYDHYPQNTQYCFLIREKIGKNTYPLRNYEFRIFWEAYI